MKRKTAKEILADSLHELAEGRQIDKITVREIAANCGYSSATFYRQFRDKYDLIAWDYARQIEKVMSRIGTDFFEKFVSVVPACVHADFIRNSSSVSRLISASVSRAAALALFRSVAALEAASALFCMVFCRALTWPSSFVTSAVASACSCWYRSRFCFAAIVAESVSPRVSR